MKEFKLVVTLILILLYVALLSCSWYYGKIMAIQTIFGKGENKNGKNKNEDEEKENE